MALIFSEAELDEILARDKAAGRLTLIFTALTWCRPCKAMTKPVSAWLAGWVGEGGVVFTLLLCVYVCVGGGTMSHPWHVHCKLIIIITR